MEKTHQVVCDALLDFGRIEWKMTLKDLEKAPDIDYNDVVKEFDAVWCVEGLSYCH